MRCKQIKCNFQLTASALSFSTILHPFPLFVCIRKLNFRKRRYFRMFECKMQNFYEFCVIFLLLCCVKTWAVSSFFSLSLCIALHLPLHFGGTGCIYKHCIRPSTLCTCCVCVLSDMENNNGSEFKSDIIECCAQNKPNSTLLFPESQQNKLQTVRKSFSHCTQQFNCSQTHRTAKSNLNKEMAEELGRFGVYLILWWQKIA